MEGVNPGTVDTIGMSPLAWAVMRDDEEAVRLLLAVPGFNANSQDPDGHMPLLIHAIEASSETVLRLIVASNKFELNRPL